MNFAAQFFANFVNDGLETRRSFNDSEEYDPFWQRWETSVYSTSQTFLNSKSFYVFFKEVSSAHQACIYLIQSRYSRLSKQYGMEIFLKKELLHYTGSVKERGALFLLSSLKQVRPAYPLIHTTYCAQFYFHIKHVGHHDGEDDSAVYLAGLGTVGLEIYEQVPKLDAVIVPASGNYGLLTGTAAAIKHLNPRISVIGVEPEDFPLLLQSLKTDSPIKDLYCNPNKKLYRDLMDHSLGTHCFQLAKKTVDKVISVREADALVAMLRFQEYERSTVDTEGAMGLAAILAGQLPELKGKRVAVVVSSANMELDLVLQCVERALVLDDRVSRFTVQLDDWPGDMAKLLDLLAREDCKYKLQVTSTSACECSMSSCHGELVFNHS
uniref:L-serine deaminase n=1 Tax=Cyprinus carpio TaxID=7962 RepID=A0A8C1LRT2_CYPCA